MIVIDASALVKLIVDEPHSDFVRKKIEEETAKNEPIYAPDIILVEVSNVLWKYSEFKKLQEVDLFGALEDLIEYWNKLKIGAAQYLIKNAVKIAKENKLSVYDSLYLSQSLVYGAPLLSFDRKLMHMAERIGIKIITN
ncbi:MAG: type II toxin-antitoxin system VapC family toxin [Candidatus Parvarchaeum sp.]